ncbi:MAG: hypothetical protein AAFN93_05035 [Bacteroidota bacterium]
MIIISSILQGCSSISEIRPIVEVKNGKLIYEDVVIRIHNCRTGMLYIVKNNKLYFPNGYLNYDDKSEYNFEINIEPTDFERLQELAGEFLVEEGDLVLENSCMVCGSPSKLMIEAKNIKPKRVFIDNFFDFRFNEMSLIIDKYLSKQNTEFSVTLGEGIEDLEYIKMMIEDQNSCDITSTKESKISSLYSWCEPPSWESNNF